MAEPRGKGRRATSPRAAQLRLAPRPGKRPPPAPNASAPPAPPDPPPAPPDPPPAPPDQSFLAETRLGPGKHRAGRLLRTGSAVRPPGQAAQIGRVRRGPPSAGRPHPGQAESTLYDSTPIATQKPESRRRPGQKEGWVAPIPAAERRLDEQAQPVGRIARPGRPPKARLRSMADRAGPAAADRPSDPAAASPP